MLLLVKIKKTLYSFYLIFAYSLKLRNVVKPQQRQAIRCSFSKDILKSLGVNVVVENIEKVPKSGQYIVVSNHRSTIDPPIVDVALDCSSAYGLWIVKKSLYDSLMFGRAVKYGGCIPVNRENVGIQFFKDVKKSLKDGNSIFMFPEGTRNTSESALLEFKNGFAPIAKKNKVNILPVYIKTRSEEVLSHSLSGFNTQDEVVVQIGDVIDYSEADNLEERYREIFQIK